MAKFVQRVDIYAIPPYLRKHIQPGQHISAGGAKGVYLGQTAGGSDVAMWEGNARGRDRLDYMRSLRSYAQGV